jgi:hypothetical protein
MSTALPFAAGAALAVAQLIWSCVRHPLPGTWYPFGNHPLQGLLGAATMGALLYGGIAWVVLRVLGW